jgi:hypothetical protein
MKRESTKIWFDVNAEFALESMAMESTESMTPESRAESMALESTYDVESAGDAWTIALLP